MSFESFKEVNIFNFALLLFADGELTETEKDKLLFCLDETKQGKALRSVLEEGEPTYVIAKVLAADIVTLGHKLLCERTSEAAASGSECSRSLAVKLGDEVNVIHPEILDILRDESQKLETREKALALKSFDAFHDALGATGEKEELVRDFVHECLG